MKRPQISITLDGMKCHLLIPNLFWPDPSFNIEALPHLETLLARGRLARHSRQGLDEWLCRAFQVEAQQNWPVAPLTLKNDAPGYWLRADPVHLQLRRDHLGLLGSESLAISESEADSLLDALNRHFAPDDLLFARERPDVWLLRLPDSPDASTCPLPEVLGRDIDAFMPKGADAMRLKQIMNETQMLLHEHPVNETRALPINSVWLWGGGTSPKVKAPRFESISSDNPVAWGLARKSGIPFTPVSENAESWLADLAEGEHLVILESLLLPSRYGDENEWDARLRSLEANWFKPLRLAVQNGLELGLVDNEAGLHLEAGPRDLWKFWKRSRPLLDYLK